MIKLDPKNWSALLESGQMITGQANYFPDIKEPIKTLNVMGVNFKDAFAYYLVFHARAVAGQQGTLIAIEAGALVSETIVSGLLWSVQEIASIVYELKHFPFKQILKPGIRDT